MTYEEKLQQIRVDLRLMATELIDATYDNPAHLALAAVVAVTAFSDVLFKYSLESCEMPHA